MLSKRLTNKGISVKQAEADSLIVSTAWSIAEYQSKPVVVIGTDTDLLVMIVAKATPKTDMHMMFTLYVYAIANLQHSVGEAQKHLMFIHAIT